MFKSQLQEYAQKAGLMPPKYTYTKEGAPHEPRFQASVIVDNVTYQSPPNFLNLKDAQHAAAQAALEVLAKSSNSTLPGAAHETGLCKNLLQEYAQKHNMPVPLYHCDRTGEAHSPVFTASVVIAGVEYRGGGARAKKEAEIKAARTALLAIRAQLAAGAGNGNGPTNCAEMSNASLLYPGLDLLAGKKKRSHTTSVPDSQSPKVKVPKSEPLDETITVDSTLSASNIKPEVDETKALTEPLEDNPVNMNGAGEGQTQVSTRQTQVSTVVEDYTTTGKTAAAESTVEPRTGKKWRAIRRYKKQKKNKNTEAVASAAQ